MRVIDWPNKPRDPRIDPQPGDVLAVRDANPMVPLERRWVERLSNEGHAIRWSGLLRETTKSYVTSIKRWRKWAATAEVIAEAPNAR